MYRGLDDCVMRIRAIDHVNPLSFCDLLHTSLKITATYVFQILKVLEQFLNVMPISAYDGKDKRLQWKRKNKTRLEKAVDTLV